MLLYFLQGSLLWQGLTAVNQMQKKKLILKKKQTINMRDLCDSLLKQFTAYFNHICFLDFDDKSKYSYLHKIFCDLFISEGFNYDHVYDWTILEYLRSTQWRKILQDVYICQKELHKIEF